MTTKNKAAQALRSIPSAIRSEASRSNGSKGGRPGRYYAIHWAFGYGAAHADTGEDYVWVYGFDSKSERDEACENFRARNHCLQAQLEAVPASNRNVRKAIRGTMGYGDREAISDVMEWDEMEWDD